MTDELKPTTGTNPETKLPNTDETLELPKEVIETAEKEIKNPKDQAGFGPKGGGRHGGPPVFVEKPKNFKQTLKRLLGYIKPHAFQLIMVLLLAAVGTVLSSMGPTVSGKIINLIQTSIVPSGSSFTVDIPLQRLYTLLLTGILIYVIGAAFSFTSSYLVAGISQRIVFQLRQELKDKLDRVPLKYYDERQYGETLSRITNDVDTIQSTLQQNCVQLINAVFTLISVTIMMTINGGIWATLVCIGTLPLSLLMTVFIAKKSQKQFKLQAKNLGQLNGQIEEMYSGYQIVKVFNMEERNGLAFEEKNKRLAKSTFRSQFLSGLTNPANKFVSHLNYILMVIIGAVQAIQTGSANLGNITAMTMYSSRFGEPIQTTSQFINVMQNAIAAAERVFEVLDAENEDEQIAQYVDLSGVTGRVRFEHVDFAYSKNTELIKDMNLSLNPGDSVAIVGPTGAGKTTLVNLLLRFYDIDAGHIYVDDIDIASLNRKNLRDLYGMVLQDTWLFKGTIKENIKFGNRNATDEQVVEAAKKAHAHEFIIKLPDCYDTMLNEDATNISNGQRQLLTIARALLSDPKILILDEATSSVDTRTEQYIQMALTKMMKDRTSFVIAHRLSTIKKANLILVMNKGRVIEQGTHDALLAKNGFYAALYNSQFNNSDI